MTPIERADVLTWTQQRRLVNSGGVLYAIAGAGLATVFWLVVWPILCLAR